ncbi:hypothetical protein SAMN05421809_2663 [Natronorubrum daqingense]|uniref:Uncharacterized protein n=1 Tax=Natronorubrum daqingense TaxID=588898 RepID=A0A1N7EKM1_9EURY|nr:hypothetical protein SAMN05421809_2663 [Natronorubrum daqingense]
MRVNDLYDRIRDGAALESYSDDRSDHRTVTDWFNSSKIYFSNLY